MRQTSFENFIRFGSSKSFTLNLGKAPKWQAKQDNPAPEATTRDWIDQVWNKSFGATMQAILKTPPYEFSPKGLADLDMSALRERAVAAVLDAMHHENFDLSSADGRQRALAVLFGVLNQAQQQAMGIEFYVWNTQHDARVRGAHAKRDGVIFRWDDPPEGGHPSEDYRCRCYARALGIEGYWALVSDGVDTFIADLPNWEGTIDHMYLDTKDNVTVGNGTLLPSAESAVSLPFHVRDTDERASAADIRSEFAVIDAMTGSKNRAADFYKPYTRLYLAQDTIDHLVQDHVQGDFESVLALFPSFGNFPQSAQIALWDMIYNLGVGGLLKYFPNLCQAVQDGNWAVAASESHRKLIGEGRNQNVFNLFMESVSDAAVAHEN